MAAEEELVLGDIMVHDGAHSSKDIEVAHHRVLKDVKELVGGEALDELAGFEGGELEGDRRVVVENEKASIKGKLKLNIGFCKTNVNVTMLTSVFIVMLTLVFLITDVNIVMLTSVF